MKTSTLVVLIVFTSAFAYAQKFETGYYVRSSGDTIKDDIFLRKKNGYILSILTRSNQSIKAKDLRAVNVNHVNYTCGVVSIDKSPRKPTVRDTVFLEVMVRGRMSLLYMLDEFDKSHFYIEDETGDRLELGLKILDQGDGITFQSLETYKESLKLIFADCRDLFPEIDRTRYTKNSMSSIFEKLHQCKYSIAPKNETHKDVVTDFGPMAGISSSNVNFAEYQNSTGTLATLLTFDKSNDVTAGIFSETRFARAGRFFSLRNELTFRSFNFSSNEYNNNLGYRASGSMNAKFLKYSLVLRASLSPHKLKPFINVGASPAVVLSQKNQSTATYNNGSPVMRPLVGTTKSMEIGFFGGVGLSLGDFSLEARYERSQGLEPELCNMSVNTLYFLLSYRLFHGTK